MHFLPKFGVWILGFLVATLLATANGLGQEILHSVHGDLPGDALGGSLSRCGDVNNDGYPDFIVGLPKGAGGRGVIRVHAGQTGALLFTDVGVAIGDALGHSVGGGADINNDGFDDFIAGAPFFTVNFINQGMARVYSGPGGNLLHQPLGDATNDYLGFAVATTSDMDGDGFGDFIAGVPGSDLGAMDTGLARVYSGQTGVVLHDVVGAPSSVVNSNMYHMGDTVSDLGDVNADGVPDFAAGAPFADWVGKPTSGVFRVYSGATGAVLYQRWGAQGDALGSSLSGVGDVDKDGHDDFLAGAPGANAGPALKDSGLVRVYSGKTGAVLYDRFGDAQGERLGTSVSGAGDWNGDTFVDFMAGAIFADAPHEDDVGRVLVYSGQTGKAIYQRYGATAGGQFGAAIDHLGDVNANGDPDLLVGEPGNNSAGALAGAAHVIGVSTMIGYGQGCAGSLATPTLALSGTPTPGGQIEFAIFDGVDGSVAFVLIGLAQASASLGLGCTLNTAPLVPLMIGPIPLGGPIPSPSGLAGGTLELGLPPSTPLGVVYFQAFVVDVNTALGFANTNGVEMSIH